MSQVFSAIGLKSTVAAVIAAAGLGTLAVLLILARRKPQLAADWSRCAAFAVLLVWPSLLIAATFFGAVTVDQGVILVPFQDLASMTPSVAVTNMLGNVMLFAVPAACLAIARPEKVSLLQVAGVGLAVSVSIEAAQFFVGRNVSTDDVWLNLVGACVGYALGRSLARLLLSPVA